MCTALTYKPKHHYFGRNLDLERGFGEQVVITPRNYPFAFRYADPLPRHHAMIGMAAVVNGYPLYFEATNEHGLSMAGLNFPGNAYYPPYREGKCNIAPFELIPRLLGSCADIAQVRQALEQIHVVHSNYSEGLPVSPLHWLIADREEAIVLECTKDGMKIFDNPFGVLTNNPSFDYHLANICNFMGLQEGFAVNNLSSRLSLENYSLGLGAFGLPGDFSSSSRFVKTVFVKEKSRCGSSDREAVVQFFHILRSVAMPKGCVVAKNGEYEYTRYSSCCNTDTLVYHYNTYDDMTIRHVALHDADPESSTLFTHPAEEPRNDT
jgi:choloylglycine hydrolase